MIYKFWINFCYGGDSVTDPKLYTLLEVCDAGSYTRAAQQLSLTQPAVSNHIRLLEEELGVKLFNRVGNTLKLTREGETVVKYARRIRALRENLTRSLEDERRNLTRLTVGVTHTSESNSVAEALASCRSGEHSVSITIVTDTITNLLDKLANFELDIAIVEGGAPRGMNSLLLDTDFLVLAVSNNHPLARRSLVTLDNIRNEPMILRLPGAGSRNLFVTQLESRGLSIEDFNVILEVDNIATIKDLIRRDFGVSILPKSVCLDELKKGKMTVLPIENLSMTRETNIVYNDDFEHHELLQDIVRAYNQAARQYQ